jgi:hypothetical protein
VVAALAATVTAAGIAPNSSEMVHTPVVTAHAPVVTAHPSARATHVWIVTGWNIHLLNHANPALAQYFFDTPSSYGTGTEHASSPVIDGFTATPVLWYTSYQQFAADVSSGTITYPYQWVYYDPEHWSPTPVAEQQDPGTYMRLFAQLAHAHGYKVIEAPARDLGDAAGSACPLQPGENLNHWYIRCGIAGLAAADGDMIVLQDEANMRHVRVYRNWFNRTRKQALAANPTIPVIAVVSTNRGSPTKMIAAAKAVNANGYYVTIRSRALPRAVQFFQAMQTAGY